MNKVSVAFKEEEEYKLFVMALEHLTTVRELVDYLHGSFTDNAHTQWFVEDIEVTSTHRGPYDIVAIHVKENTPNKSLKDVVLSRVTRYVLEHLQFVESWSSLPGTFATLAGKAAHVTSVVFKKDDAPSYIYFEA